MAIDAMDITMILFYVLSMAIGCLALIGLFGGN